MIKKNNLILPLVLILLCSCSFDNKTGIWSGGEKEKQRISDLEKEQKQIVDIIKVYSSDESYSKELSLKQKITLSEPIKNLTWKMSSLNYQNSLGHIFLSQADDIFLKKKIGKDKFSLSKNMSSLLFSENNIIFSDDTGTIFNIKHNGKINWKKNIYTKIYKKIYKNLTLSIYKNNIYIADNIGFIYSLSLSSGKLLWIKNHGIPLKSNIKVFEDKIFLINQDNRLFCLSVNDGRKIWDVRAIASFIKTQNFLSIAITKNAEVVAINSSGDLLKVDPNDGNIYWSKNTSGSMYADATDFFKSSEIVVSDDEIIFSAASSFFSYNLYDGFVNWEHEFRSAGAPIVDGKNIFLITENGYFIIIRRDNGEIISSNNILKILKRKKQNTKITGFIMGSGKIYSVTLNGYLIVSSAISGKVESFKKIGDKITSNPVINDGKLYILTNNSKIIGLN